MSSDIIRLGAGDFDETIAFLNGVFAEHAPHDFANLLPSIYQPTDEHMRCNYAVREGGRLAAVVGSFPIDWRVGGASLKIAGIGGVAVHKDFRGKGYMKLLMHHAVDEMRREGADLSYLGGRRQRYAYFGYEVAGLKYRLAFNPDNIRHTFTEHATDISFSEVTDDDQTVDGLKQLHDAQAIYCERSHGMFNKYLRCWHYQPMIARDESGQVIGYIAVHSDNEQVNEFVARDKQAAVSMVRQWGGQSQGHVILRMLGPIGPELRALSGFAESTAISAVGNWQVFNWRSVIDALMRVRHNAEPMPLGAVSLRIEGCESLLRLIVDEKGARCVSCDGEPDLTVSHLAAHRLLFGPTPPSIVMPLPLTARLLSAWCPLPLGISPQDKV